MKTCGYCGRENEDSAAVCRECGQSEFPETAEEKNRALEEEAREAQARAAAEREPEVPESDVASGEEACICSVCLFPNLPEREWCKNCGAPFNTSVMGPFESAIARGFMYRGIVRGRPKPIILVTVWVACAPIVIIGAIMSLVGLMHGLLPMIAAGLLACAIPGSILFQVTRNFITIPKPKLDD